MKQCGAAPEPVYLATRELLGTEMEDDRIVLDMESGRYLAFEGIGGEVWDRLKAPATLSELATAIVADYAVDEGTARGEIQGFLEQLVSEGLVCRV